MHRLIVLLLGVFALMSSMVRPEANAADPAPRFVDLDAVAKTPAPGTVVPGAFAFTPDGKSITYLKSEDGSLSRVYWKVDLHDPKPHVIARPPGSGDTDTSVSLAEALRRERQRLRDTGITQVIRASKAEVTVIPLGGDLYIQKAEGPLERLTSTPSPEIDPKLTSDGASVAFVRDNELHVLDLATKKEIQLSHGATEGLTHGLAEFMAQEEMDRFTGFWWSPDRSKIAYQETDERHIPLYTIVHQGGSDPQVETHRYPFPGKENAKVKLGVVSKSGGETQWLKLEPPTSDFYLARVDWENPTTLLVQLLSRDQKILRLSRVDLTSGTSTTLLDDSSPDWVNLHNDLRVFGKESDILWTTERSGYRHIRVLNNAGVVLVSLTSGDWPVDAVVGLDETRREVYFSSGKDSYLETHLYRVSLDSGEPIRMTTEPGTHRVVMAPDGNHFVDTWSSVASPPRTVVRDREGKVLFQLDDASSDARVKQYVLTPPEFVTFPSRDGAVTLQGAYYAPKKKLPGGKSPLIVMLYGGPHVQYVSNAWAMTADMTAQYYTAMGFAVWKMDNRGSARRGHVFESPLHLHMGEVEVRDQVDGVRFAVSRWHEIDPSKVGVTGGSYGGYMTIRCLTEAPETFHAGVANAPVTDWDGYDTCYTERYMGTPSSNKSGYDASSVLNSADRLAGKLMIVHGLLDENVHFRHSSRFANSLIKSGKPFEFLPLPNERHSTRNEADRRYVGDRASAFFHQALVQE